MNHRAGCGAVLADRILDAGVRYGIPRSGRARFLQTLVARTLESTSDEARDEALKRAGEGGSKTEADPIRRERNDH